MKISGWVRLWIVAAVLWWGAGAFMVLPKWPPNPGVEVTLKEGCEKVLADPDMYRGFSYALWTCERSQRWVEQRAAALKQWDEFTPLFAVWLIAPLAALFGGVVIKWIVGGFQSAKKDSSGSA